MFHLPLTPSSTGSFHGDFGVKPRDLTADFPAPPTRPLRPINPDNACGLRITAAAGTKFAATYSRRTISLATFSGGKGVYTPKCFILHAASLHQAFAHCGIFSTAASRRSRNRISVSSLGNRLSPPLPVIAKVRHYHTF